MGWEVWLIIALVCLIIEFLTVDFSFLMLGGGAFVGTGIAVGTENLTLQIVGFSVTSVILLFVVRPWAKKRFNPRGSQVGSVDVQLGRIARTLTMVDADAGRVKIGGDVWSARSRSGSIPEGVEVIVAGIDGAIAVVETRS